MFVGQGLMGLPLAVNGLELVFGDGFTPSHVSERRGEDSRKVLLDSNVAVPDVLYRMYRCVGYDADKAKMGERGIRFDLTLIRPGNVGREYIKTVGHYHPTGAGQKLAYPEVYQVLQGKALCVFQKPLSDFTGVEDVIVVEVRPKEVVVVPPGYGHVTVNVGHEPLLLANLVEATFKSIYEPYANLRGAAYYVTKVNGKTELVQNKAYKTNAKARRVSVNHLPTYGFNHGESIYEAALSRPEILEFLVNPSSLTLGI